MSFQVGDKVRVLKSPYRHPLHSVGTVVYRMPIEGDVVLIAVAFPDDPGPGYPGYGITGWHYESDELEAA